MAVEKIHDCSSPVFIVYSIRIQRIKAKGKNYVMQNGSETFCIELLLALAHKQIETPVFVLKSVQRQRPK